MRTGIVALAHLGEDAAMAEAAVVVSALTHPDPDRADVCVLWCSGVRAGLDLLSTERQTLWTERLDEAEAHPPHHFGDNGRVVHALQAAWSAIIRTTVPELLPGKGSFPLGIRASPWGRQSGPGRTPTPSRRSQAPCSARGLLHAGLELVPQPPLGLGVPGEGREAPRTVKEALPLRGQGLVASQGICAGGAFARGAELEARSVEAGTARWCGLPGAETGPEGQ